MLDYLYNLATDRKQGLLASILKFFLLVLSFIYRAAVEAAALFCRARPYQAKCKVISVGNITWGGTGKTPLVELISRCLKEAGHRPAILSRGYRHADEPRMLSGNLAGIPVIIDKNRVRAAIRAVSEYEADVVILDDGFQQWRIKKDLEIVTIDAKNPFGNRCLLPAGILRQGLSALKRADVFLLTKVDMAQGIEDLKDSLSRLNPRAEIFESVHQPVGFYNFSKEEERLGVDSFRGKSVALFSGIADPDSFEDLIRSLGIDIGSSFRFRDHHIYTQNDLEEIMRDAKKKNINIVITTEKDAARLLGLRLKTYNLQLFILRICLKIIANEEKFLNRLLRVYPA